MTGVGGQPLILIVEDEPTTCALAAEALQAMGCRTSEAGTGGDGLRLAAQLLPDAILLDVMMPDIDGYSVCQSIRRDERTAGIPVILATSLEDTASIERGFEAGATDFVVKPVDWTLFAYRLRFILRASRLSSELRDARAAAEASSATKSAFLARMSHELRSPLNSIIGFSDTINRRIFGPVNVARYADYIADIHDSAQRMAAIIQRLVDLAQLNMPDEKLDEKRMSPVVLIDAVAQHYEEAARAAGVSLTVEHDPAAYQILADPVKIGRALGNLISNAVAYSAQGGAVRVTSRIAIDGSLRIEVADTGIGMTADQIDRVLRADTPGLDPLDRGRRSTGLGLPFSNILVRQHGGRITLESEPGRGTRAALTLPKHRVARHAETPSGTPIALPQAAE
jgi:signal transduction histidine kinase